MECRPGCGACCIAPSINHPLPGMPLGKPAGMACVNLDPQTGLCGLWGSPEYPPTCHSFQPEPAVCGTDRAEAIILITRMEQDTLS